MYSTSPLINSRIKTICSILLEIYLKSCIFKAYYSKQLWD